MVKGWREGVWRNAERLVNAGSAAARRQVANQIHQNAATWARMMAAPQTPGYRAKRDAYCAAQRAKGTSAGAPTPGKKANPTVLCDLSLRCTALVSRWTRIEGLRGGP